MLTIFPVIILLLMIVLFLVLLPKATLYGNIPIFSAYGSRRPRLSNTAGTLDIFLSFQLHITQNPTEYNKCSIQITQHSLLFLYTTLWEASRRGLTDTGRQIALYPPLFVKVVSIPHCHERWSVCLPGATLLLGDKFHFLLPFS